MEGEKRQSPVLEVHDLKIAFSMYQRGLKKTSLKVIQALDLAVQAGEVVAVVGASGSGKSLLAHAIMGILPENAAMEGQLFYKGQALTAKRQRILRGKEMVLIPQSVDHLDPLMRVGKQVIGVRGTQATQKAVFRRYGLKEETERKYPFQLSGGMARRVLIATAVTVSPQLIIADEPTPGLSGDLARETLKHFRELADAGTAVLLITHDVDLAIHVADRIAVFYAGMTVELAGAEDFQNGGTALRHPYSKALISALPQNTFQPIPGKQPYAGTQPAGCLFAARCSIRTDACNENIPMRTLRNGEVRCIHAT